jgi:hypothetical protein
MKTLYCFSDVLFLTITTSNEINYVLGFAVKRPFVTENKVIIKRTAIKGVVRVKLGTCKAVFSVTDVKGGDNLIKRFNPLFNGSSVKFIRFFKSRFYIFQFGFPLCQPTQGRQRKMDRPTTYWFGAAKLRTGVSWCKYRDTIPLSHCS